MKKVKLKSVSKVESSDKKYDISVHTNNNYFADGILVHNCNIYSDGSWHARSIETPYHPTREWAGRVAGEVGYKLPDGWKICAENLYGTHSIKYTDLRSYVQVYGIVNDKNRFLSWDETVMWCELLDLQHTQVLWEGTFDRSLISGWDEQDVCDMAGRTAEGYVMRVRESFPAEHFEFNVGKWVRAGHVQTDEHWLRKWEKNGEKNELYED
jgi:hypothetical protein